MLPCKGLLINSAAEITECRDISWNASEPPPSDSYLNLLIRWIKSKVCDGGEATRVCDGLRLEDHKVC